MGERWRHSVVLFGSLDTCDMLNSRPKRPKTQKQVENGELHVNISVHRDLRQWGTVSNDVVWDRVERTSEQGPRR